MQALALAKLKTLGDGYGGGAARLADLGMQFVLEVPMQSGWDGREYAIVVIRTTRLPTNRANKVWCTEEEGQLGVLTRIMATTGGRSSCASYSSRLRASSSRATTPRRTTSHTSWAPAA